MNHFFAPTNEWGDNAVKLTPLGIVSIIAVIVILIIAALLVGYVRKNTKKLTTRQLVFSSAAIALAMVTSFIKLIPMPLGGSATLLSMLFIVLIGYWYGPAIGIMTGMAYGLLQFVVKPIFYTIPQMLVDYPLAFGALGIAGFFYSSRNGLTKGYIAGILGRYFFTFWSGLIFFAAYAESYHMSAPLYSLLYNGSYLLAEAVITLILINIPPVKKSLQYVKKMAAE